MAGFVLRKGQRLKTFATVKYRGDMIAGEGIVKDLSLSGSYITGNVPVSVGIELSLQMFVPGEPELLVIDRATVKWIKRAEFGVDFHDLQPEVTDRITQLIATLVKRQHGTPPEKNYSPERPGVLLAFRTHTIKQYSSDASRELRQSVPDAKASHLLPSLSLSRDSDARIRSQRSDCPIVRHAVPAGMPEPCFVRIIHTNGGIACPPVHSYLKSGVLSLDSPSPREALR